MRPRPPAGGQAAGYTLIEVLLVIALMVAVAALVWPNATALIEGDRLPRTADDLRGLLVGLRQRAIDEGRSFTIEFQQGSSEFAVRADEAAPDPLDDANQPQAVSSTSNGPPTDWERATPEFDSPEVFGSHQVAAQLRFEPDAEAEAQAAASGPRPGVQAPSQRSAISVRFEIDGSANDCAFWLVDGSNEGIRFEVRGATGVIKVARVRTFNGAK